MACGLQVFCGMFQGNGADPKGKSMKRSVLHYLQVNDVSQATFVKVTPVKNKGKKELCPIVRSQVIALLSALVNSHFQRNLMAKLCHFLIRKESLFMTMRKRNSVN